MKKLVLIVVGFAITFLLNIDEGKAQTLQNYDRLIPIAKKYIGVPYQYGGTTTSGFDCSGYVNTVFNQIGVSLPRTSSSIASTGSFVSKSDLRPGDLVLFNTYGSGVSHVGIYIGDNQFIHASSSHGVMISDINDPYYWKSRYVGARRVLSIAPAPATFKDLSTNNWVFPAVKNLAVDNLILGYTNGYFKPNDYIGRADVAAMLAESFDLKMNDRSKSFPDVPASHWAVGVVNAVYDEGIFQGSGSQFKPDDLLTRGQMAAILVRAFDLKGTSSKQFTDVPASHWAYSYINKLAASGITTGYEDGTFKPEEKVTRSQFAAFLYRAKSLN